MTMTSLWFRPAVVGLVLSLAAAAPSRVAWERTYGSGETWYEYKAATVTPAGEIVVAATAHVPDTNINTIRILHIDLAGKQVGDVGLDLPHANIEGIATLPNGELLLVAELVEERPAILRLDAGGKVLLNKAPLGAGRRVSILKTVVLSSGNVALLGRDDSGALALAADPNGRLLWEKRFDCGKSGAFVGATALPDGGLIVVGNNGDVQPSRICVVDYGPGGEQRRDAPWPGRFGSIARASNGTYGLVVDRGAPGRQDVWLLGLDGALKAGWEVAILAAPGVQHFRVAALASGGFVVAGGKDDQPYVVGVSAEGKRSWDFWGSEMLRSESYAAFASREQAFVASSVFVEKETGGKRTSPQRVRIVKFESAP